MALAAVLSAVNTVVLVGTVDTIVAATAALADMSVYTSASVDMAVHIVVYEDTVDIAVSADTVAAAVAGCAVGLRGLNKPSLVPFSVADSAFVLCSTEPEFEQDSFEQHEAIQ